MSFTMMSTSLSPRTLVLLGYETVLVPTSTMNYPSVAVETGSLYLVGRDHRLYLLRLFMPCEVCEKCRRWSTFHGDKVKGQLVQKSLEHGHHYTYRSDVAVLQQAGLM
ncbi:hypothetical protein LRD69_26030 [Streptomyces sp. JH14]|uniref:hypothetical protein n=1 Tax=Streptomyces sp. JH14 TaxID=2793630 RepID=UPI0023F6ADCC|nr:hypothetical protein [Streptomyces sp. JH14]MDF6045539.1 hypothetical protein [Streptomyces sp. JH14]